MLVIAGILIYTIIAFGIRVPRANDSPPPAPEEADLSPPIATSDNSTSTWNGTVTTGRNAATDMSSRGCFPSLGFTMPQTVPPSTNGWWCNLNTEYAFMGFSYDVTACQSLSQMRREFQDVRKTFNGRYIRIYGACDRTGFYDDVIQAAWDAGVGVYALIWFGFDGSDIYKTRRDTLFSILHSNPLAPYVIRALQFGSEPLFDYVLTPSQLATEVRQAKEKLKELGIPVVVSEMAYGYQAHTGSQVVLDAQDYLAVHMLPYFSQQASTASQAWPIVENDLNWFINNGGGKKIVLTQNGWPSMNYSGVEANSPHAVSDVANERDYALLLDDHCTDLKQVSPGGVGWFWHIYSDSQLPGYGVYNTKGTPKFEFRPRTEC